MSDHGSHFNVVSNFGLIELECFGHTAINIMPFGKKQAPPACYLFNKSGRGEDEAIGSWREGRHAGRSSTTPVVENAGCSTNYVQCTIQLSQTVFHWL